MPMFSSLPDWVSILFTLLILFALGMLIYLLFNWLGLQKQLRKLRAELERVTRERDRDARTLGSLDRQKTVLQSQLQKANDEIDTLTRRLAETTGLLSAARAELIDTREFTIDASDDDTAASDSAPPDAAQADDVGLPPFLTVPAAIPATSVGLSAEPDAAQHGLHAQLEDGDSVQADQADMSAANHETQITGLRAELTDARVALAQYTQATQHVERTQTGALAELQDQLHALQARYTEAQTLLGQYEAQLSRQQQWATEHGAPPADEAPQLSAAHASETLNAADLAHAQERVGLLTVELADSKAALSTAQAAVQELQRLLVDTRNRHAETERRKLGLEAQVHDLLSQIGIANGAIVERDSNLQQLAAARDTQHAQVAELSQKLSDVQALFDDTSAKLAEKSAPPQVFNSDSPAVGLLGNGQTEIATADARQLHESLAEREATILALNSRIVTLQSRLVQANEAAQMGDTRLMDVARPDSAAAPEQPSYDPDHVNAVVAAHEQAIAELKAQLGNAKTSLDLANDAVFARAAQLAQRDQQILELSTRLSGLETQVAQHAAEQDVTNATLAERLTAISELNQELDALDQTSTQANPDTAALQTSLAASRQAVADLTEQLRRAQETPRLDTSISNSATFEAQWREAQNKIKAQGEAIEALTSKLRNANADLDAAKLKISADGDTINALYAQRNLQIEAEGSAGTSSLPSQPERLNTVAEGEVSTAEDNNDASDNGQNIDPAHGRMLPQPMGDMPDEGQTEPLTWLPVSGEMGSERAGTPTRVRSVSQLPRSADDKKTKTTRSVKSVAVEKPTKLDWAEKPDKGKKEPKLEKTAKPSKPSKLAGTGAGADIQDKKPSKPKPADDSIEEITGIGSTYAAKLHKAGIRTFKELAKSKPGQLERIIKPKDWQKLDFAGWISQAKMRLKR